MRWNNTPRDKCRFKAAALVDAWQAGWDSTVPVFSPPADVVVRDALTLVTEALVEVLPRRWGVYSVKLIQSTGHTSNGGGCTARARVEQSPAAARGMSRRMSAMTWIPSLGSIPPRFSGAPESPM